MTHFGKPKRNHAQTIWPSFEQAQIIVFEANVQNDKILVEHLIDWGLG